MTNINANSVLSLTNKISAILGIEAVDQFSIKPKGAAEILHAQAMDFARKTGFHATDEFFWPTGVPYLNTIGVVAMTAMAMIDSNNPEDFRKSHEDKAAWLKFPGSDYSGDKYQFMHGGLIFPEDPSYGDDLYIRPDGLVHHLFDSKTVVKEEMIIKFPRTYEQLCNENGLSDVQKRKLRGDMNFIVYPSYYTKGYYTKNLNALEELRNIRSRTARALADSNPMAEQGNIVQVLILGFVTGYYLMTEFREKSIEKINKGQDVPLEPYCLAMYMPCFTVLSKELTRSNASNTLNTVRTAKQHSDAPVMVNNTMLRKLGYSWVDPVDDYEEILSKAKVMVKELDKKETIKEVVLEVAKDGNLGVSEQSKPIEHVTATNKDGSPSVLSAVINTAKNLQKDTPGESLLASIQPETSKEETTSSKDITPPRTMTFSDSPENKCNITGGVSLPGKETPKKASTLNIF